MTRDEIIRMAEDCGISHHYYEIPLSKKGVVSVESCTDRLCQFAKLIAQQEREACAKLCDGWPDYDVQGLAEAIRARNIDAAKVGEVGIWGEKREWVGLTDEEAWKCWDWEDFQGTWKSMEAKLKEKNT